MEEQMDERRLTDEARAQHRADLMAAIADEPTTSRRWLAPVAVAAAVAGLVGGGYAVTRIGADDGPPRQSDRSLAVAGSGPATSTQQPTQQPTPDCRDITSEELEQEMRDLARHPIWQDPAVGPSLRSYRDILARHLDPGGRHLQDRVTGAQTSGSRACGFDALGTKLGWTIAGEDGQGMVEVEVARPSPTSQSQVPLMFDHWDTVRLDLPGVAKAEVAGDGARKAVLVTRTDGLVVGILADPLFGNNSLTPVSGFDFAVSDLLATAADPDFALPE